MAPACWTAARYLPAIGGDGFARDGEGLVDAGDGDGAGQFRMARDEGVEIGRGGGLADGGGDVEGVEIAGVDEAIDGVEVDVVGVDVVGLLPAEGGDGLHRRRRARWRVPSPRCRVRDWIYSRRG